MNAVSSDRIELVLRATRRSLMIVLALILLAAATLITHVVAPQAAFGNWAARAPWLIPIAIVVLFAVLHLPARRLPKIDSPEMKAVLADEFRQANLARAQRVALAVVLFAQIPLEAIALSRLGTEGAVTVMAVATVTSGLCAMIVSFLIFDRE